MSCVCAIYDGEGRYNCSITGDGCLFLIPNQKLCHETYGDVSAPEPEEGRGIMATEDWEDFGGDLANMDFESQNLDLYEDEDDWED